MTTTRQGAPMTPDPKVSEPLPCPFCGESAADDVSNGIGSVYVECRSCGAQGPAEFDRTKAIALWNRRTAASADAVDAWRPIETAPKDGTEVVVYAPARDGLHSMVSKCAWHPDAGFCIDELRHPTHWQPLPMEAPHDHT